MSQKDFHGFYEEGRGFKISSWCWVQNKDGGILYGYVPNNNQNIIGPQ
jgi:hypothetical protein